MPSKQELVSILTRPEGRVQPHRTSSVSLSLNWFQSSPGQKAGCNLDSGAINGTDIHRFNPHPARRPGATLHLLMDHPDVKVSILTRPEGRVQRAHKAAKRGNRHNVSILTRPEGRVQRPRRLAYAAADRCFNPHPARRPGATIERMVSPPSTAQFQSSPGQKAGCNRPQVRPALR